ncbi:hypothetical protein [Parachlamydia sp. AcF125]|uniref:hypothetical protein n=1 Tax=Parachlamydia sp. AcF125 TaxID=2795736 RepID=UPI001BD8FF20|nr:hypothetical protein [Parachlamydia sp. AcF125]MBS4168753.1 hypothetical protein [Parachlamydia sp. AcF125]
MEVNGTYVAVQERVGLFSSSYEGQKGIHLYSWNEPELREYTQLNYSQLLIFISATNFRDVKYDNLPFKREGRIALIDPDKGHSPSPGLTQGGARKKNGLFNSIPAELGESYLEAAKAQLKSDDYRILEAKVPDIKANLARKLSKRKTYLQYLSSHQIVEANQQINSALPALFKDACRQQLAKVLVESINQELEKSRNYSLPEGRVVALSINIHDELAKKVHQIWENHHGSRLLYVKIDPKDPTPFFKDVLEEVSKALIQAGLIHRYKLRMHYHYAKIAC